MIVFPEKLLVIETTFLPINVILAERQPSCLIFGSQDVGAYLLRILLPTLEIKPVLGMMIFNFFLILIFNIFNF